jgi:hypothetical protein
MLRENIIIISAEFFFGRGGFKKKHFPIKVLAISGNSKHLFEIKLKIQPPRGEWGSPN